MSRLSNRAIEQHYFEQFRKHYSLPAGELEYSDKPDVIIRGTKTLGIEIANLYVSSGDDPSSEQVQRPCRARVLERAHALHLAAGGDSAELSVDFDPKHPIHEIESTARQLAELAAKVSGLHGPVNPSLFASIPQLRYVYRNSGEYPEARWHAVQSHRVPALSVQRLRDVVSEKAAKAEHYLPCDTYWLLLVVDFIDRAQDQDIGWPQAERLGESPFERVLLYKPQFAQVVRVP